MGKGKRESEADSRKYLRGIKINNNRLKINKKAESHEKYAPDKQKKRQRGKKNEKP